MRARPKLISRSTIYQGRVIRLVRDVLEIKGARHVRETILHPGAVVIVPLLDHSRIVFVRQYRRAVDRELLELPAGTRDRRESMESCARRELQEETGYRARRLRRLVQFYAAPGILSEQMTIFLAEDLQPGPASPEPDEDVRTVILTRAQALAKVCSGTICDAKTLIGLLMLERLLDGVVGQFQCSAEVSAFSVPKSV